MRGEFVRTPSDQHIAPLVCPALRKLRGIIDLEAKCIDFGAGTHCAAYCGFEETDESDGYLNIRCRARYGRADVRVQTDGNSEGPVQLEFEMQDPSAKLYRVSYPWWWFALCVGIGVLLGAVL